MASSVRIMYLATVLAVAFSGLASDAKASPNDCNAIKNVEANFLSWADRTFESASRLIIRNLEVNPERARSEAAKAKDKIVKNAASRQTAIRAIAKGTRGRAKDLDACVNQAIDNILSKRDLLIKKIDALFSEGTDYEFTLFSNPGDATLLSILTPERTLISYFGNKDDIGLATSLNVARVDAPDGTTNWIHYDALGRPVLFRNSENDIYFEFEWLSDTVVLVTVTAEQGAIQAKVVIDVSTLEVAGTSLAIGDDTDNLGAMSTLLQNANLAPRGGRGMDSFVSSYEGEPDNAKFNALVAEAGSSIVTVTRCDGVPVTNAVVDMLYSNEAAGLSQIYLANHIGNGQYKVNFPTEKSPGTELKEICNSLVGPIQTACTVEGAIPPGAELQVCTALTLAVASTGAGAVIAPKVAIVCGASFAAYRLTCKALAGGLDLPPGSPDLGDALCNSTKSIVDFFFEGNVFLAPTARVDGKLHVVAGKNAPASGPFPSFSIEAGGEVEITKFYTEPTSPLAFQGYTAFSDIACAPAETLVIVSIVGTDGYSDSTSHGIQGNSTVSLFVPGAEASVVDTITVQVIDGPSRSITLVFR